MAFSEKPSPNSSKVHEDIAHFKEQYLRSLNLRSDAATAPFQRSDINFDGRRRDRSGSSCGVLTRSDSLSSTSSSRRSSFSNPLSISSYGNPVLDPQGHERTFSPRSSSPLCPRHEGSRRGSTVGDAASPNDAVFQDVSRHQPTSHQSLIAQWKRRSSSISGQDPFSPGNAAREKFKEDYIKSLGLKERSPPSQKLPKLKERVNELENIIASDPRNVSLNSKPKPDIGTHKRQLQQNDGTDISPCPFSDFSTASSVEPSSRHGLKLIIPSTDTFQLVQNAPVFTSPDSAIADISPSLTGTNSKPLPVLPKPSLFLRALTKDPLKKHTTPSEISESAHDQNYSYQNLRVSEEGNSTDPETSVIGTKRQVKGKKPPPVCPKPRFWRKPPSFGSSKVKENLLNQAQIVSEDRTIDSAFSDASLKNISSTDSHKISHPNSLSCDACCGPPLSPDESRFSFDVKTIVARYSKSMQIAETSSNRRDTSFPPKPSASQAQNLPQSKENSFLAKTVVDPTFTSPLEEEQKDVPCETNVNKISEPRVEECQSSTPDEKDNVYSAQDLRQTSLQPSEEVRPYTGIYRSNEDSPTNHSSSSLSQPQESSCRKLRTVDFSSDQKVISKTFTDKERAFILESISNSEGVRLFRRNSCLQDELLSPCGELSMKPGHKSNTKESVEPRKLPQSVMKRFDVSKEEEDLVPNKSRKLLPHFRRESSKTPKNSVRLGAERFQKLAETHEHRQKTLTRFRHSQQLDTQEEEKKTGCAPFNLIDSNSLKLEHIVETSSANDSNSTQNVANTILEIPEDDTHDFIDYQQVSTSPTNVSLKYATEAATSQHISPYAKHVLRGTVTRLQNPGPPTVLQNVDSDTSGRADATFDGHTPSECGTTTSTPADRETALSTEEYSHIICDFGKSPDQIDLEGSVDLFSDIQTRTMTKQGVKCVLETQKKEESASTFCLLPCQTSEEYINKKYSTPLSEFCAAATESEVLHEEKTQFCNVVKAQDTATSIAEETVEQMPSVKEEPHAITKNNNQDSPTTLTGMLSVTTSRNTNKSESEISAQMEQVTPRDRCKEKFEVLRPDTGCTKAESPNAVGRIEESGNVCKFDFEGINESSSSSLPENNAHQNPSVQQLEKSVISGYIFPSIKDYVYDAGTDTANSTDFTYSSSSIGLELANEDHDNVEITETPASVLRFEEPNTSLGVGESVHQEFCLDGGISSAVAVDRDRSRSDANKALAVGESHWISLGSGQTDAADCVSKVSESALGGSAIISSSEGGNTTDVIERWDNRILSQLSQDVQTERTKLSSFDDSGLQDDHAVLRKVCTDIEDYAMLVSSKFSPNNAGESELFERSQEGHAGKISIFKDNLVVPTEKREQEIHCLEDDVAAGFRNELKDMSADDYSPQPMSYDSGIFLSISRDGDDGTTQVDPSANVGEPLILGSRECKTSFTTSGDTCSTLTEQRFEIWDKEPNSAGLADNSLADVDESNISDLEANEILLGPTLESACNLVDTTPKNASVALVQTGQLLVANNYRRQPSDGLETHDPLISKQNIASEISGDYLSACQATILPSVLEEELPSISRVSDISNESIVNVCDEVPLIGGLHADSNNSCYKGSGSMSEGDQNHKDNKPPDSQYPSLLSSAAAELCSGNSQDFCEINPEEPNAIHKDNGDMSASVEVKYEREPEFSQIQSLHDEAVGFQLQHESNFMYPATTDPEDGLQERGTRFLFDQDDYTRPVESDRKFSETEANLDLISSFQGDALSRQERSGDSDDRVRFEVGGFTFPGNSDAILLDSPVEDVHQASVLFQLNDSYSEASGSFNSLLSGISRRSSDSSFHSAADFSESVVREIGEYGKYKPTQESSCEASEGESLYGSAVLTPSLSQATTEEISSSELWSKLWEVNETRYSEDSGATCGTLKGVGHDMFEWEENESEEDNRRFSSEGDDDLAVEVDSLEAYSVNDDEYFEECSVDNTKQTEMVRSTSWDEVKFAQFVSDGRLGHSEDAFSAMSSFDSGWGSPRLARFVTLDSLQVEDLHDDGLSLFDTFTPSETIEEVEEEEDKEEETERSKEDLSVCLRRKSGVHVGEFSRLSIIEEEESEDSIDMWSSAISSFDTSNGAESETNQSLSSPRESIGDESDPQKLDDVTESPSTPSRISFSNIWQEGVVGTAIRSGMCWMFESKCGFSPDSPNPSIIRIDDDDDDDNGNDNGYAGGSGPGRTRNAQRRSRSSSSTSSSSSSPYGSMERDSLDGTYENLAALSERLLWEEQSLVSGADQPRESDAQGTARGSPGLNQETALARHAESPTPEHVVRPSPASGPVSKSQDCPGGGGNSLIGSAVSSVSSSLYVAEESIHLTHSDLPGLDQACAQETVPPSDVSVQPLQSSVKSQTEASKSDPLVPTAAHPSSSLLTTWHSSGSNLPSASTSEGEAGKSGLKLTEEQHPSFYLPFETSLIPISQTEIEELSGPQSQHYSHAHEPIQTPNIFTSPKESTIQDNPSTSVSKQTDAYQEIKSGETDSSASRSHLRTLACSTAVRDDCFEANQAALSEEPQTDFSHPGMADSEDGELSTITGGFEDSSRIPASASGSSPTRSASNSSSASSSSSKIASSSPSSSSISTSHSSSKVTVKSSTTMMSAEDPGPVRRKSLDLGKSKSEVTGRRRHNTDMDEMVEELMRAVEDDGNPLLDESTSSLSSPHSSSSESSPSQTSMQRIASASSLRKSAGSDPYKALERSQSDASLMRDLILLDSEEVHLTAAESSSGQNISECNRVYLDLSRAEAFERVEHGEAACSIMRTSSGRHLETIPQDEELKTEDLSYMYNASRSFSQESSSEDLTISKSKMKETGARSKTGGGQGGQDGGNSIGPKSNLRSSFQIYSHSLKQKLRQLQMGSVPEQVNALTELNVLMEQAWSMPVYGKDLAYELCDILRTESALDIIVGNLASPNRELMKVSARLLEQSLTTSNRRQVANSGLERVVKMTCDCRGDCELAQTTTGILESLFKTSEDTCGSVIKLGGLEVITYWCRCNDRVTLKNCAIALSNLALYGGSENQQEMAKFKVPEWLFPLAFVEDDSVRYYALLAIGVLVSNKEIESAVMSSGTLALVLPFVDTHDPAEFAQRDMSHRHGRSPGWLKRLIPVLSSRREEAQALAAFHFVMEAGIKSEQGRIEVLYDIGAVEPLKWLASTPNRVASKLAGQALKIIGEEIPHKLSQQVPLWTTTDVAHWTAQIGFGSYTEKFESCLVDGDLLLRLTDQELRESVDMTCSITRKRFLRELRDLKISCDYTSCDPSMLGAWLRGDVGEEMAQYTYQMLNTGVDRPLLPSITDQHLSADCSIDNGIHRMKILSRIEELRHLARSQSSVLFDSPDGAGPASLSGSRAPIDCFISYRRSNGSQLASLLKVHLQLRGFTVFIDIERLRAGKFDESLLESVRQARNFIIVLTANSLDRCMGDEQRKDWVHKEITAAIESGINIIPLIDNFRWPSPETLPEDMRNVCYFNHVRWIHDYQDACVDKLERFIRGETNPLKFVSPAITSGVASTNSPHGNSVVSSRNESVSSPVSHSPQASSTPSSLASSSTVPPTRVVNNSSSTATSNTDVSTTTSTFAGPNSPPYRRAQSLSAAHSVDIEDSPTSPT